MRIVPKTGIMLSILTEGDKRMAEIQEIRLGDVVMTRKQHPCGSSEWTVIRTGADIKIKCNGCCGMTGPLAAQRYKRKGGSAD